MGENDGRRDLGRMGETIAARFLVRRGGQLIERNASVGRGEIDLVVRWPDAVVAVEVKTRVDADPSHAYTADKSRSLREAVRGIRPRPGRLDLVLVRLGRHTVDLRWIPGVT